MLPMIVRRNQRVCLALEFLWATVLGTSFFTLYFQNHGLSQTQIFALQAIITVVMVIADLPLGYIADRFGVRRVIIAGTVVQVTYGVVFLACQTFWQFAICYVLSGLFLSALSNTTSTVMTRSVAAITDEPLRQQTYGTYEKRRVDARNLGFVVSAIVGGVLVAIGTINWPFRVQPFIYAMGVVASLALMRLPQQATDQKRQRVSFGKIIRTMLANRPDVRYVIFLSAIVQMAGFACLWLFQPRMQLTGMPVWLFSAVYLFRSISVLVFRRSDVTQRMRGNLMWLSLALCMPVGALAAALTTGYVGLAVLVLAHAFMSAFYDVMTRTYLYRVLPNDYQTRTTELSVMTTVTSLSFMLAGLATGWVKDTYSLSAAFIFVALLGLCLGMPVLWAFRRHAQV